MRQTRPEHKRGRRSWKKEKKKGISGKICKRLFRFISNHCVPIPIVSIHFYVINSNFTCLSYIAWVMLMFILLYKKTIITLETRHMSISNWYPSLKINTLWRWRESYLPSYLTHIFKKVIPYCSFSKQDLILQYKSEPM